MRHTDRDPDVLHLISEYWIRSTDLQADIQDISDLQLNLQDLSGSTTQSATRSTPTVTDKVRKQPPVANPVVNTVDSISHAHFRSNFRTPDSGNRNGVETDETSYRIEASTTTINSGNR